MFLSLRKIKAFSFLKGRWKITNYSGYYALGKIETVLVDYFEKF